MNNRPHPHAPDFAIINVGRETAVRTNHAVEDIMRAWIFPAYFCEILRSGSIDTICAEAIKHQSAYLLLDSDIAHRATTGFLSGNIHFLHDSEGLYPNMPSNRGYAYTITDPALWYAELVWDLHRRIEWNDYRGISHIGIYPNRIPTEKDFMSTLNHEVHHYLLYIRILYDFMQNNRPINEVHYWFGNVSFRTIRLFITEALGHLEWAHMQYFHWADPDTMWRNAGIDNGTAGLYKQASEFGAKLLQAQIWVYNHLARQYGLDASKPPNFQLKEPGNTLFQQYAKWVTMMMIESLYDIQLFNSRIAFFGQNFDNPATLLHAITFR